MTMQHSSTHCRAILRGALLFLILVSLLIQPAPSSNVSAGDSGSPVSQALAPLPGCQSGKNCLFFPMLRRSEPMVDLVLDGIEVTQAIQNETNSVPLVAGRPAVLRVYAHFTGSKSPVTNAKVLVTATRSGNMLGGGPLAINDSLPINASRANYDSSVNFAIPQSWLSGVIDVTVRLDPDNSIFEEDETNNSITRRLTFNAVPALKVKIVPVEYTHTLNQHTYAAPTKDTISDWIRRTYPVSSVEISWHAPYRFTGNLKTIEDFTRLLNEVTSLKSSEGAPDSQVYYGLVPVSDSGSSWFNGGYAGVGWMGMRAAVGLNVHNQAGEIAAHEIGHNMGMPHTPCGGAAGADGDFPYTDGSIGQYGLDVYSGTIYDPTRAKDMMSYCYPKWVSDYTYQFFFNNQVKLKPDNAPAVLAPEPGRVLLVRAQFNADGAQLMPSYVLDGQADAPRTGPAADQPYLLQALDAGGAVLAEIPVSVYNKVMEGVDLQGIHALVPLPEQPAAWLRLVKGDQVLAEQPLRVNTTGKINGVSVEEEQDGYQVRWTEAGQPVMVRYTADGGSSWTTLGVDVTGGEMHVLKSELPAPGGTFEVIISDTWQ